MPLQILDLGIDVEYIEINVEDVPYTFTITLADKTYQMTVNYNASGEFFTIDLETLYGEVLCYGDPVRYGRPLFGSIEDERFPLPVIIPQCLTGDGIDTVTFENFGKEVQLYLYERQ